MFFFSSYFFSLFSSTVFFFQSKQPALSYGSNSPLHMSSPLDISSPFALGVTGPAFSILVPDFVEDSLDEDLARVYLKEVFIFFCSLVCLFAYPFPLSRVPTLPPSCST